MARDRIARQTIDDTFGARGSIVLAQTYIGTIGDDSFVGTEGGDGFDLTQGGSDAVSGESGNDQFYFGEAFDADDRVDGGGNVDTVWINGFYSNVLIAGDKIKNVEGYEFDFSTDCVVTFDATAGSQYTTRIAVGYDVTAITSIDASALDRAINVLSSATIQVLGGRGNDALSFSYLTNGDNRFDGGGGFDGISFNNLRTGISIDLSNGLPQVVGGGSITLQAVENVTATYNKDTLIGTDGSNTIFGGGGGNDRISGNGGDDWIVVGSYSRKRPVVHGSVDGGDGFDFVSFYRSVGYNPITVSLSQTGRQDTGVGTFAFKSIENVVGFFDDDAITGNRFANQLFGYYGDDHLIGGAGDDVLAGDGYVDWYTGDTPTFIYTASFGGPKKSDQLDGGVGDDTLYGGVGDDFLTGGPGADTLNGAAGVDRFLYASTGDSRPRSTDIIVDFSAGDVIDVSAIDARAAVEGDQRFHLGATRGHAGDIVVVFDTAKNATVIDFFVDGDSKVDMTIHLLGDVVITEADFIL